MNKLKGTKVLATVLYISGTFDIFGGIYFSSLVGTGRSITNPPTHPFYAVLIASFLFCFGILQYMTAINVRRYLLNIGIVTLSRLFYAILFFSYFLFAEDFPSTFLPTAIADVIWVIFYIVIISMSKELHFKELFLPKRMND